MTAKRLAFDQHARERLRDGVRQLARAVGVTLGPRGRNVVIEKSFGPPLITKDGATVAKEIELEGKFENMGAQLVRQVASKTADLAGDGTTTATVLAEAMFCEGLKNTAAGTKPVDLKRGFEKAVTVVVEELRRSAIPVAESADQITQIASIAANGDTEIGQRISEAFRKVGKEGVITIEEGKSLDTQVEFVEGMEFDNGYLSPHFVTNPKEMQVDLEEPYILIYEKKVSTANDLLPILEKVAQAGRPLLLISENVDSSALATLVVNRLRGTLSCCAVKAPGYGDRRGAMLEDIAILTGGQAILDSLGMALENLSLSDLGRARRVLIDKDSTTIVQGAGDADAVKGRIQQIQREIETTTSDYDKEQLRKRLAKLSGGVAIIRVGAATEIAMKEKMARTEDAMCATRAALEEGILPGGGTALLRAASALDELQVKGGEAAGVGIVRRALDAPLCQIARNAGLEGPVAADRIRRSSDRNFGLNAEILKYEDLVKAGVIDPMKVVRVALQNAASVSALMLTTNALVADAPKKKNLKTSRSI